MTGRDSATLRTETIKSLLVPNTCLKAFVMLRTATSYLLLIPHMRFKEIIPLLTKAISQLLVPNFRFKDLLTPRMDSFYSFPGRHTLLMEAGTMQTRCSSGALSTRSRR